MLGKYDLFHGKRSKYFLITLFSLLLTTNETQTEAIHNFIQFVVLAITKLT